LLKVAGLAVVVAVAVVGAIVLLGGDDDGDASITGPPGHEFTLLRPEGWTAVGDAERNLVPGKPLAVLRRGDGAGLITVNAPAQREQDLDAIAAQLDKRLRREISDFRKVGARVVDVEAGTALLYSYARTEAGTAHTLLVVPRARRTYTLNAAVPAGAEDAAKEVGRILLSFDI
jgi:hypothetical protein